MLKVPASEFAKRYARYRDTVQCEPVAITHYGRTTAMLISKSDFDEYVSLRQRRTRAVRAESLGEEWLAALQAADMDPRHHHLNALLDEG